MKLPESWMIFGQEIKILYVLEFTSVKGMYDHSAKTITIYKHECPDDLKLTIMHELGHAVADRLGLNQAIDSELMEIVVEGFAKFFCESFDIKL